MGRGAPIDQERGADVSLAKVLERSAPPQDTLASPR